jgi:hypothetical protein
MHALSVPLTAIKKLSDEQRFAYYLLGHIFNELMCLQKLVGFTTIFGRNTGPAPHSTVTLLARLRGLSTSVPRAQAVW